MRERHLSLSLSYSCHPFTIPRAPKGLRSAAILPQVCVCLCVCVCAYVCNLCVYPHASVLCGTNRGLPWSAFGASSPIGVKEVRLVRSTSAGLISWGTSFTGTSGLECLTTKSIGLAPIPVVLTPRPPRGSSSAIVMDFHHTLRALTPTLSDSALVLSGNSLCLGLKTFLSMYEGSLSGPFRPERVQHPCLRFWHHHIRFGSCPCSPLVRISYPELISDI